MCLTTLKASFFVALAVLLLSSSATMVSGQETSEDLGFSLQSYAPARVLISYTYTNNFSVTDVSSIGRSLYTVTSGPTSIEFRANQIAQYTFTVEIRYATIVAQSVQIAIFSAGYAPEGIQYNVKGNVVRLKFTLTVTEEPRYPSAQDVAEQVVRQVAQQLTQFEQQTSEIVEVQNRNLTTMWILIVSSLAISVALLLITIVWIRPRMRVSYYEEGG